ncbi:MAG: xanthine dehydrogenase family protein molybdopterin-binding subunit [Actinobacteria bacterium]|nr:xanthine dehydrogenase family protein molybdopterin-binding subunit [Actinomycetota bacterium]
MNDVECDGPAPYVGRRLPRREDGRLLTGTGKFVDDVDLVGQLWMRVVRSPIAHARIESVDTSIASALPGVALVLTGVDVAHLGRVPLEQVGFHEVFPDLEEHTHPVLAHDVVNYVGQPVAAVFATSPYGAEDAAEHVSIEYEALTPQLDPIRAASQPPLHGSFSNEAATIIKRYGDVESAFGNASHVVHAEYFVGRHSGVPLETRGIVVEPDPGRDELCIWGTVHVHDCRRIIAMMLGMPTTSIRMRTCDIGGNFGVRGGVFPEYPLAAYAARRLRRPVKWVEDRLEHMTGIAHAREQVHRISGAFDKSGRILGLKDEIWHNHGAFLRQAEPLVSDITAGMVFGPYRVPAYEAVLHAVLTNKTPLSAYRAPGRYEGTFARERLLDRAAAELGVGKEQIRRTNLLSAEDLPWQPGLDIVFEPYLFDSGDVRDHFDKALAAAGFDAWQEECVAARAQGRLLGTGIGVLMDKAGLGLYETGSVEVDSTGRVRVLTGASSVGQGIETVLAQIVADVLQVDPGLIDVLHSDTALVPDGVGSWSSRSTVIAGGAAREAAVKVVAKARRVAAKMLEADEGDLELTEGRIAVRGDTEKGLTLAEIAGAWDGWTARLNGDEPGLRADSVYVEHHMNYPFGVTLAQIEIDPTTGGHRILRFFTSSECGRMINPQTTEGQVIGAAAQGIGGALFEEFVYDDEGQPLSTLLMDYIMPTSTDVPTVEVYLTEDAPTRDNPMGAKGLGEVGLIAVGAAIASAIDDAVGATDGIRRLPATPQAIWELVGASRQAD